MNESISNKMQYKIKNTNKHQTKPWPQRTLKSNHAVIKIVTLNKNKLIKILCQTI